MHEFNICQTIVDTVNEHASRLPNPSARITKTVIVMGLLRQLVPEYMQTAYEILTKGTKAEGSVLEVKHEAVTFTCDACGKVNKTTEIKFSCPSCGSKRGRVDGGRELYLESLEVEEDE